MRPGLSKNAKISIVISGYFLALLAALTAIYLRHRFLPNDNDTSSPGMSSFSDLILFLAAFGFLAIIPTAVATYFLRTFETFWRYLSYTSVAIPTAGLITGVINTIVSHGERTGSSIGGTFLSLASVLSILGAPLMCIAFLVLAAIAPKADIRRRLFIAAALEVALGAYAIFSLLVFKRLF